MTAAIFVITYPTLTIGIVWLLRAAYGRLYQALEL
jgi:hypothetical protein